MSTIELRAGGALAGRASARALRMFSAFSVLTLLAVDIAVVAGAFVIAYDLRFVLSDAVAEAFPFELYLRTGFVVGAFAILLLVLQGMGDLDRQRSWPTRLRRRSRPLSRPVPSSRSSSRSIKTSGVSSLALDRLVRFQSLL